MNSLKNKVALITGSTSGIGETTAKRFADAGATVIICGRNIEKGNSIVSEIVSEGGKAFFHFLDIQDDKSVEKLSDFVKAKFGNLDILFNNAGVIPVPSKLEETTREDIQNIFSNNFDGMCSLTISLLPLLRKRGGVILNNASIGGLQSYSIGKGYMYSASKAAVIKFSQMLAKNEAPAVRTNIICPGVVRTPVYKKFDEERYRSSIPLGRVGEPMDIASVANFFVSDEAAFVNGAVIVVDGGQSI